ncbi:uncharacterized protein LOC113662647 isoform X2 [Tachysurus fulvidraco]|uniref:uncharacterized protein LOC113662647 isoform X2 n=1 Tax=Tachysurus fulvidraco TaxID=1234273 RepID=UPI000F5117D4|nr:uncharacterized protein LOC113662647 isoform X2 [Tachysurus fulvidraco]
MAGEERTIRVSGLPVDVSENRLIDKLQIHFLRKKNGGGEISAVTVSKTVPGTAFITFEEGEVALRLAQKGKHVFNVSDKSYDITMSLHREEANVDKVLLYMSLLVDHKKIPGGKNTLLSLHKSFPGVQMVYDFQKELYTLKGRYSEVQSLSSLVLGSLEKQDQSSGDKAHPKTASKKMYNSPLTESASCQVGANEDTGVVKHNEELDLESKCWKTGFPLLSSSSNHTSHSALTENKWDSDIGTLFEDFSLIVDSDIFRYLHQYSTEYQSILRRHKVEVLDVNCDDITTLYLKPKTALSSHDMSSVIKAHEDLAHLYQQKESHLRKEYVYKCGIPEKELTHALESLRERLPKLMIHEDDRNVYMVGSKSDVSEAKHFIVDMRGLGLKKEIHSEHLFVSSPSKCTFSKQGSADCHDLFMPKKDHQDANQRWIASKNFSEKGHDSVELENVDDQIEESTEDIFDLRRTEVSQEKHVPRDLKWIETDSWLDKNKYTDSLFASSKPSARHSVLDREEKLLKSDIISGEMVIDSETQIKSSKGYKSKQTETGKERKMAANFSKEMYSGIKDLTSYKSEAPKIHEGAYVRERKNRDSGQPHSLPLIKSTKNINPHTLHSGVSAQITTSTIDSEELKGDKMSKSKPIMTPACLTVDQGASSFPIMPSESTLSMSSSFSGRMKKVEEAMQIAVDVSAGQKGISQNSETREIVAMDLVLPFRLWLYLTSIYNTEIENLTSDLQVKEKLDKEDITLCLRGIDSQKVSECYSGLKSLIATAEMDFDARTLPLCKFGLSCNKDKILIELCTVLRQRYKMVKILVMSTDIIIIGPKALCDEVQDTMAKVFQEGGKRLENELSPNSDSLHISKAHETDLNLLAPQPTTPAKPHADIIMKDLSKISDQSVAGSSKKFPQVLSNQTADAREQVNQSRSQKKMKQKKMLEQLDDKDSNLTQDNGGTMNIETRETSSGSIIISATRQDKADGELNRDQTITTAQSKETFIDQINSSISVDQMTDSQALPGVSDPKNNTMPSQANENQSLLLCYVCEKEHSTVKQAACGFISCPKCEEVHNNCRICMTSGIKGTMTVQESTITIPGFNRDTTLRIIYDIPNGIQGEDHPYPGEPFKGNRFEAFLPYNKTTTKLLPLLKKAFYKGLTFTVKVASADDDGNREGTVVWGSIPHKTKTEGGTSKNGYPDFNYITRLEEVLKAAGIGD